MNDKAPLSDEQVEAMVKARLEERAREIDPQPLLARLQERLETAPQASRRAVGLGFRWTSRARCCRRSYAAAHDKASSGPLAPAVGRSSCSRCGPGLERRRRHLRLAEFRLGGHAGAGHETRS